MENMIKLNDDELLIKKSFISFLKENNVYYKFIQTFVHNHKRFCLDGELINLIDFSFNSFIKKNINSSDGFLVNAFEWKRTDYADLWKKLFYKELNWWQKPCNKKLLKNKIGYAIEI